MFDRKQKTLQQEKVDHTFVEKVLNVVKERVDNSQRDVYKLEQIIFELPQKMQCNTIFNYFKHYKLLLCILPTEKTLELPREKNIWKSWRIIILNWRKKLLKWMKISKRWHHSWRKRNDSTSYSVLCFSAFFFLLNVWMLNVSFQLNAGNVDYH